MRSFYQAHLRKNEIGRFEVEDFELTSGSAVELKLGGQWIAGRMEFFHDLNEYVFITRNEGSRLQLNSSILARILNY